MARPPKKVDWNKVIRMIQAKGTAKCISKELELNINTFYIKFNDEFGYSFQDYAQNAHETAKENILFTQYAKALSGNGEMLKLLGKEWCGQGLEAVKESPLQNVIEKDQIIMRLEHRIALLEDKLHADKSKTE